MSRSILDCSIVMAWFFEDQADTFTEGVLDEVAADGASVPSIWPLEVANALLVGERRNKASIAESSRFLSQLSSLRITVDEEAPRRALEQILELGRNQRLSAYDAAYLELAMREGLPLATRDESLRKAARAVGVELLKG